MTLDELKKRLDNPTLYVKLMRPFWRVRSKLVDLKWELKAALLRAYRGYDDMWHWEIHSAHTNQMIKSLNWLIENHHGVPGPISVKHKKLEAGDKEWVEILTTMRDGFQAAQDMDNMEFAVYKGADMDWKATKKEEAKLKKKFDAGMKLFVKHYFSLWD